MPLDRLPFRLHPTGRDTIDMDGVASVSYRLTGELRLSDECITLRWTGTRTVEQVTLDRVGTDVEDLPVEGFELPYDRIEGAWVTGGWWRPRLQLRTRSKEDLDGVPASRGVLLSLVIHRRDRGPAREIASEIEARAAELSS
jgi:hypothetical protein